MIVAFQILSSLLDLFGILIFGFLVKVALDLVSANESVVYSFVIWGMGNFQLLINEQSLFFLALISLFFIISKSVISFLLTKKIYHFLGAQQSSLSASMTSRLLNSSLIYTQSRPSQEFVYCINNGAYIVTTNTLGSVAALISESFLLIILGVALMFVNFEIAFVSLVYFLLVGVLTQKVLARRYSRTGLVYSETAIRGQRILQEIVSSFREITVLSRKNNINSLMNKMWLENGIARADQLFLIGIPKILYENFLILGLFFVSIFLFSTLSFDSALTTLSIFLIASTRIIPSFLRINNVILGLGRNYSETSIFFQIYSELSAFPIIPEVKKEFSNLIIKSESKYQTDFQPNIEISGANFYYPNSQQPALLDISLKIDVGLRVAITGKSGSGKSTLADLILGLINPNQGLVQVSGVDAELAIKNWPGKISYVPQAPAMIDGTILENIALGLSEDEIDRVEIENLLEKLQLLKFLKETREGLDTWVGERGVALSGGQKQRLGLARALYLKPKLLILDEATSALDAETEEVVSETISMLSDDVTVVSIAHRLATIRYSDFIVHLEKGEIAGIGNFSEMKTIVPEFRNQAKLLGL